MDWLFNKDTNQVLWIKDKLRRVRSRMCRAHQEVGIVLRQSFSPSAAAEIWKCHTACDYRSADFLAGSARAPANTPDLILTLDGSLHSMKHLFNCRQTFLHSKWLQLLRFLVLKWIHFCECTLKWSFPRFVQFTNLHCAANAFSKPLTSPTSAENLYCLLTSRISCWTSLNPQRTSSLKQEILKANNNASLIVLPTQAIQSILCQE